MTIIKCTAVPSHDTIISFSTGSLSLSIKGIREKKFMGLERKSSWESFFQTFIE